MEQLDPHRTDSREKLYCRFSFKSVDTLEIWLKSVKITGTFGELRTFVTKVTMVVLVINVPMVTMVTTDFLVILFTSVKGTCEVSRVQAIGGVKVEFHSFLT